MLLSKILPGNKKPIDITRFALLMSVLNFVFFHYAFFKYVIGHIDMASFNGILLLVCMLVTMVVANLFTFYLFFSISRRVSKVLLSLCFVISAVSVYFVNNFGVIIDGSMVGNVFNTNYAESSNFFSFKLLSYILLLGVLPSIFIFRCKIVKDTLKKTFIKLGSMLLFLLVVVFVNAPNWLWIDKNSKELGGLAMPWSYTVNTALLFIHKSQRNAKEIPLPPATIRDQEKAVMVLVIGESARRANFSLYGYDKNTNPLLSATPNLYHFDAESDATYTTAGVKAILEHEQTGKLYEILPNYLFRTGVDVYWRTTNWGEPPVHIDSYMGRDKLEPLCKRTDCAYDGVLLAGLREQIMASKKSKILVVLHTSTSHGPIYSKKYPKEFEVFTPVCNSVELDKCSQLELINAYDNSIVYTDFLLHSVIEDLKALPDCKSTMIYVSDHGESLGENNLYMHGLPKSIAPKEQYEIPFIVWVSDEAQKLKNEKMVTQGYVFHSVLHFLHVDSPVYNEKLNIYE